MAKIQESVISFTLRGKPKEFTVYHNLADFGLDIEAAFINWSVRTKNVTDVDFAKYVKSKDPNIICLTKKQYQSII